LVELFSNDHLIIVGNTHPEKKDVFPTTMLSAITYKSLEVEPNTPGVDRFGDNLSQSLSLSSGKLNDANNNNVLELNERAYLELEIENTKSTNLYNVTAKITGSSGATELGYWEKIQVGVLKAGQKKKVYVPIVANESPTSDSYELNIDLDVNGRYASSSNATVDLKSTGTSKLVVQAHEFIPGSAPQPGQQIRLNLTLANTGTIPTASTDANFNLPNGVRALDAQMIRIPPINPRERYRLSFTFVYDQTFRQNAIDIVFQTKNFGVNSISQRYSLEVKSLMTANNGTATNTKNNNTRSIGDMMVWMSHDPDEKGSKNFVTNDKDVDIKLKILTSRKLEKNRVSVYINGNKYQGQKMDEVKLTSESKTTVGRYNYQNKLRLREGENKVRVVYEENGVDFSSPELVFDYTPKDKPNLYVISIGVKHQDLQYTVKDAEDFAAMYGKFRDEKNRRVFKKVEVMEVTEEEMTTANNIKAAFIRLARMNIKDGDLVVIFISSHGKVNNSGDFILIPSDYNSELEEIYSVNFREDILKKLRVVDGNKLVFIDACHSGSALASGSRSYSDQAASEMLNGLIKASSGMEIIASCGDNEYSYEDQSWGNGAFTKSIIEAFSDQTVNVDNGRISADIYNEIGGVKKNGKDGIITIEELKYFIQKRVPYLVKSTKKNPPTNQQPSNKSTELLPDDMGIFVVNKNE
ncbi:MAG: caspase family protein, partial [Bacteroidota bacterium]